MHPVASRVKLPCPVRRCFEAEAPKSERILEARNPSRASFHIKRRVTIQNRIEKALHLATRTASLLDALNVRCSDRGDLPHLVRGPINLFEVATSHSKLWFAPQLNRPKTGAVGFVQAPRFRRSPDTTTRLSSPAASRHHVATGHIRNLREYLAPKSSSRGPGRNLPGIHILDFIDSLSHKSGSSCEARQFRLGFAVFEPGKAPR